MAPISEFDRWSCAPPPLVPHEGGLLSDRIHDVRLPLSTGSAILACSRGLRYAAAAMDGVMAIGIWTSPTLSTSIPFMISLYPRTTTPGMCGSRI